MFEKFLRSLGLTAGRAINSRQVARSISNMGGSVERLSRSERRRLTHLTIQSAKIQSLPPSEQVKSFFETLGDEVEQMNLVRQTGAFDRIQQQQAAKAAAVREVFRTGFALPPALQSMLDDVPVPALRAYLTRHLREALLFRPVMPQRQTPGLTFFGGLPMAPKGLIWPRYTDPQGAQHPAHFIGQIHCADIPDFGLRHLYPASGILFFFYPMGRNGYRNLVGDLVVHMPESHRIAQVVPPASIEPYKPKQGSYRMFWLHELDHPHLPKGSILPKWEMEMGVGLQLNADAVFANETCELSDGDIAALQRAGYDDAYDVTSDFVERMQRDPAISFLDVDPPRFDPVEKAQDGITIGFKGFPHTFHAMHTVLGGYRTLLDEAAETYRRYIAFVDGDPAPFYAKPGWEAPEHHPARKQQSLAMIEAIARRRREITAKMEDLGSGDLAAAPSDRDRSAFWALWRDLSSEGALKLECHLSDDWNRFLNNAFSMNGIVERAARHCVLASCCNGPEGVRTLPPAVAQAWMAAHQAHPLYQRYRHQSAGYAPSTQNSEEDGIFAIPLMQFPDAGFRDFESSDMGALQYWLELPDFQRHDVSAAWARVGN